MASEIPVRQNGTSATTNGNRGEDKFVVKTGLAKMLKGGVIMDVVNAEQVSFPLRLNDEMQESVC